VATLKASGQGIIKIKQARKAKGWPVDDFQWIEAASEVLGTSWKDKGIFALGISEGTWKRFLAGKTPINAEAFKAYCQVLGLNWEEVVEHNVAGIREEKSTQLSQDWGDAPDTSIFYGRQDELRMLGQWIGQENCRLVTLLGMGGIGKTTLSVKLARQLVETFEFVIWRSLRNAPPIEDLLADLIQFLSRQQAANLPTQLERRLSQLLKYLRASRCLLILDNGESILQAGDRNGRYRTGYEGYGQLLRCIAETNHSSCLILTSREKPSGLTAFEGESLTVRSLQLSGLPETAGRELFNRKGTFTGTEAEWQILISRYAGNPLALKIVASSIHDFFEGNLSAFLETSQQNVFLFDDIGDLLKQHFQRLTSLERDLMYSIAINREPTSLPELQADFAINVALRDLLESLNSLERRALVEKSGSSFTQQPVVMEYVTAQLIARICQEIEEFSKFTTTATPLFISYALLKATAKDYIRETQTHLILQPIVEQLMGQLGSPQTIAQCLKQILATLRGKSPKETGYAAGNALNLLHHLEIDVSNSDFSGLTVWQAYLQGVNLHDVNFAGSDLSRCVFTEAMGNSLSAAFSPDGKLLATGDTNCHVCFWEVQTGKLIAICRGHKNWVRSVTFSRDGQVLASCGADDTIKLWTVCDGIEVKTLIGHTNEVFTIAWSLDSQTLISGGSDRTVKIWDIHTGTCLNTLSGHTGTIRTVACSPEGSMIASGSDDSTIKLWNRQTGDCLATIEGHTDGVRSLAFRPNDLTEGNLLSSSSDRTIKLWNIDTATCVRTFTGHQGGVYSIALSPDGKILVSGSGDHSVKLWNLLTGECIKTLQGHGNQIFCVAFSPQSNILVSVSLDQTVRLWDWNSGSCIRTLQGHTDWPFPVAFSADGQWLASGSADQTVKVWDWQTGQLGQTLRGHTSHICAVAFSPIPPTPEEKTAKHPLVSPLPFLRGDQGGILASSSRDKTVRIWDVTTGSCLRILPGHGDWVYAVAFCGEGNTLISGSADRTVRVWDWQTGQCLKTLRGHTDQIWTVACSSDGKYIASGSTDRTVRIWDVQTGECLHTLEGHTNRIKSVAFSPDGQTLASGSTDQTVKLWDLGTGKCLQTLTGHSNWVFAVAFSPNRQILASASHDQTVRLWSTQTGKCLHICAGHTHLVSSVAFSRDGHCLASGSQDQTVRIWDVGTSECVKLLRVKRIYEGMKLTGAKGLTQAAIATLQALGAVV
jgi:WD40 repeat protein